MKYRVSVNDILWEINNGKPRRLMCDEFLREIYAYGVGCWNESVPQFQPEAILKRLPKLEAGGEQRIRKIPTTKSNRKKRL